MSTFVVVRSTLVFPSEDDNGSSEEEDSYFSRKPQQVKQQESQLSCLSTVSALWIMDSVTNFELQPVQHYLFANTIRASTK